MTTEAGFLAAIAAEPDDDTHRLIFADWLEEHDQPERAELIRVQCELEPVRDDHDNARPAALRQREEELLRRFWKPWCDERAAHFGGHSQGIGLLVRRGLPASVQMPVQWFLDDAEVLRREYPTIQRLDLFRVHGWGERLARCPHLAGIRELEIACWVAVDDLGDLLESPHLGALQLLRVWLNPDGNHGEWYEPLRDLNRLPPALQRVEVLWGDKDRLPDRPLFHCFDPFNYKFAMAPGGGGYFDGFFPGKLPDGTQVFGQMPTPNSTTMPLLLFDHDGNQIEERALTLPTHLVPTHGMYQGGEGGLDHWWAWEKGIAAYLVERLGHRPCLIRVKDIRFSGDWGPSVEYLPSHLVDELGLLDEPDLAPEDDGEQGTAGVGGSFHDWIHGRKFVFWNGNDWFVDGITGDVEST